MHVSISREERRARIRGELTILAPHPLIVADAGVELLHERIRLSTEAPAPAQPEPNRADARNSRLIAHGPPLGLAADADSR